MAKKMNPSVISPYGKKQERLDAMDAGWENAYSRLWDRFAERFGFENIALRASKPNRKTDEPSFSLPAIMTCQGATKACVSVCYASYGNFNTDTAGMYWRNYLALLKSCPTEWADLLEVTVLQVLPRRRGNFRIHVAGDFFEQTYVDAWCEVARRFPRAQFWAYTRAFHLDFSGRPTNVALYASTDHDNADQAFLFSAREGCKLAYMGLDVAENSPRPWFQCPGPGQLKKVGSCAACELCIYGRGRDVAFAKH